MKLLTVLACFLAVAGSGQTLEKGYLWSPNVEYIFEYKSSNLIKALRKSVQHVSTFDGNSLQLVASVKVQAFGDMTLRVKLDQILFYSNASIVSQAIAHQILRDETSNQVTIDNNTLLFKKMLTTPFLLHIKRGVVKKISVSQNEPAEITEIKKLIVSNLEKKSSHFHLQLLMKKAIVIPLETPRFPMKVNIDASTFSNSECQSNGESGRKANRRNLGRGVGNVTTSFISETNGSVEYVSKLKMRKNCILISCGSFNPPTIMHLRLFELAKDHLQGCGWNVLGGIISPVLDNYKRCKPSLKVSYNHRVKMVELALESYDFVRCSKWESEQDHSPRIGEVLEEHLKQINQVLDTSNNLTDKFPHLPDSLAGLNSDKKKEPNTVKLFMVGGGDFLESISVPNLWKDEDIEVMLRDFGLIVITRQGSNPKQYVEKHPIVNQYKDNIYIVKEKFTNDISSTKVREAVKNGDSVKFFVDNSVISYISENELYL